MIFPHTQSRRLTLRPATAADQAQFARTRLRSGIESFRPGGGGPPRGAGSPFDAAFVVQRRSDGTMLGFSTLHGLDTAGHVRCGIYLDPRIARFGVGSEAIHLTVNFAFATFNVDRVITQTTEASFGPLGLAPGRAPRTVAGWSRRLLLLLYNFVTESRFQGFQKNGVLHDHLFFRGRPFDLHSFQISRRNWDEYIDRRSDTVLPTPRTWRTAPSLQSLDPVPPQHSWPKETSCQPSKPSH